MELTAFTSRLGKSQGRIRPSRVSATLGEHLIVLGDEVDGYRYRLTSGDHVELKQDVDLTGVDFVRIQARLTVPPELPSDLAWNVSILVGGIALAVASCRSGRSRELRDLAANVSKHAGVHQVALRLELVKV